MRMHALTAAKEYIISSLLLLGLVGSPILESAANLTHLPAAVLAATTHPDETEISASPLDQQSAPRKAAAARRIQRERAKTGDPTNRTAAVSVVQEAVRRELRRRRPIVQPPVVFVQTRHIA